MDVGLNWLWQGAVVAVVAAALLRVVPRGRTTARYSLVWAAVVAVLMLPAVPFVRAVLSGAPATPTLMAPPVMMPIAWWTSGTAAVALWMLWAAVSVCRTAVAMVSLRAAKRQARPFPADVEARLGSWCALRATGRPARLVVSPVVRTAGVLGGPHPVIAVSPSLVQTLEDADLDRVVAHEWAHVQRYDDLAQAAGRVLRAVAGWHPAVWWLERQLHIEREVACDERAVAVTGCAKAYAACLTRLAAMPAAGRGCGLAAVSASGLRERVARILAIGGGSPAPAAGFLPLTAAMALMTVAFVMGGLRIVAAAAPAIPVPELVDRAMITPRLTPAADAAGPGDETRPRRPVTAAPSGLIRYALTAVDVRPVDAAAALPGGAIALAHAALAAPEPVFAVASMDPPAVSAGDVTGAVDRSMWSAAVHAGTAVGAGSQQAAVATAGFFTRFGKRVARSF